MDEQRATTADAEDLRFGATSGSRAAVRRAAILTGVFVAYLLAGKLGLSLAFIHANASAVWPPSGLAIAAMLVFGRGVWPAILAGAFVVNLTTKGSVATSVGIGLGNTLEALAGAWLVERYARGKHAF